MRKFSIILVLVAILLGGCSPKKEITLKIPDSDVKLSMRLIPAGSFMMGSPDGEADCNASERPQHQVIISKPFYMGIYEVTQAQWVAVMGSNPSDFGNLPENPVERVSWDDCQIFITKLNAMGIGTFRLPTEAEWEYAYRAGSTTRFPWGDDPGYSLIEQYAWCHNPNYETYPVGHKEPNAWGLYDMGGNVWEWCSDWYDWYSSFCAEKQIDPKGPLIGFSHILRGGCVVDNPWFCRSAHRGDYSPSYRFYGSYYYVGFRLVRTP